MRDLKRNAIAGHRVGNLCSRQEDESQRSSAVVDIAKVSMPSFAIAAPGQVCMGEWKVRVCDLNVDYVALVLRDLG